MGGDVFRVPQDVQSLCVACSWCQKGKWAELYVATLRPSFPRPHGNWNQLLQCQLHRLLLRAPRQHHLAVRGVGTPSSTSILAARPSALLLRVSNLDVQGLNFKATPSWVVVYIGANFVPPSTIDMSKIFLHTSCRLESPHRPNIVDVKTSFADVISCLFRGQIIELVL